MSKKAIYALVLVALVAFLALHGYYIATRWDTLPWAPEKYSEPNIIERTVP